MAHKPAADPSGMDFALNFGRFGRVIWEHVAEHLQLIAPIFRRNRHRTTVPKWGLKASREEAGMGQDNTKYYTLNKMVRRFLLEPVLSCFGP